MLVCVLWTVCVCVCACVYVCVESNPCDLTEIIYLSGYKTRVSCAFYTQVHQGSHSMQGSPLERTAANHDTVITKFSTNHS